MPEDFNDITTDATPSPQADNLAKEALREKNQNENPATFTLPGNPKLCGGVTILVRGWGKFDGKYIIESSKHSVTNGEGYITTITCRRVLEGY